MAAVGAIGTEGVCLFLLLSAEVATGAVLVLEAVALVVAEALAVSAAVVQVGAAQAAAGKLVYYGDRIREFFPFCLSAFFT